MNKVEKNELIGLLDSMLNENKNFYLADISGLTAEQNSSLRRLCYKREVSLKVVKNTLLKKAFEKNSGDYTELYDTLVGNTSIMTSVSGSLPAKVIKEFRKKNEKPILKAAHIEETFYIGDEHLATLADLKSKDELIGDIITLLQSPAKNVISALQSSGSKLTSIVETLKTSNSANTGETKVESNIDSTDSEHSEDNANSEPTENQPENDQDTSKEK
jgi:large subunit ribosomal protein L10